MYLQTEVGFGRRESISSQYLHKIHHPKSNFGKITGIATKEEEKNKNIIVLHQPNDFMIDMKNHFTCLIIILGK